MTDTGRLNTDREIWREREGDFYAGSIFVTQDGGIGINRGGHVVVQPLSKWFAAVSEIETLRTKSGSLFDAIQHGDDEHRAWLKAAITAHFTGSPVPPVSGSGRRDAEIETLRAKLAAAEDVLQIVRTYAHELNSEGSTEMFPDVCAAMHAYDQGKVTICD